MKKYILGQNYRGGKPGQVVELSEEEAARLLVITPLPDSEPVQLKPIAMSEPVEEVKPKRKRTTKKEKAEEKGLPNED